MGEISGIERLYRLRVTIKGYPPRTDVHTIGMSSRDWWFMIMRTPDSKGT